MNAFKNKFEFKIFTQKSFVITIILILLSPCALFLPKEYFFENSLFEKLQIIILALGFLSNLIFLFKIKHSKNIKNLWLSILPIWLILIARELSWGRAFFLEEIGPHGPEFFSLKDLWFGPYVYPILVISAFLIIFFLCRSIHKLNDNEKLCISLIDFTFAIVFIILATTFFEKIVILSLKPYAMQLEEYLELIAYWSLYSGSIFAMKSHKTKTQQILNSSN